MANNYSIQFKSLRAGTIYTLNIYGGTGAAIPLKGGAQPFVTQEDDSEDMFTPVRTQSGYLRMVDNGVGADNHVLVDGWWKTLVPATDTSRPVTLTGVDNNGNSLGVLWQGFLQAQTFSGELYGNPQEREFPVQCALAALGGIDIPFNKGLKNFAYILKHICDTIDVKSGGTLTNDTITTNGRIHISDVKVQGGSDAQVWLGTKIDWQNFAQEDADGILRAKYSLLDVLEDMCRFWGWTARTQGTTLYLTCQDDTQENATFLTMTRAQLDTLANGETAGVVVNTPSTVALGGDIFASTDQTETKLQGPHRAVVSADCNERDTVVQFAPQEIRDWMDAAGSYTWEQQPGEDMVGYFTTPIRKESRSSGMMDIDCNGTSGFCRRQIFESSESENAAICDMMCIISQSSIANPAITLKTRHPMAFGGGSLKISGTCWQGSKSLTHPQNPYALVLELGIGMTVETAKWWYMTKTILMGVSSTIDSGWSTYVNKDSFFAPLTGNNIQSTGLYKIGVDGRKPITFSAIPVVANTYGYIFMNILGAWDIIAGDPIEDLEISNLKIEFSREGYDIPTSLNVARPREMKVDRVTSKEYSASNSNESNEEWNADCIFASDNNMEYGYGLLLNYVGNIISEVRYGSSFQHPEQHLANRVATYWDSDKMRLDTELWNIGAVAGVSPDKTVSLAGVTGVPVAISHDWRDDLMQMVLIEL